MAKKKNSSKPGLTKKQKKAIENAAKKNPVVTIIVLVGIVAIVGVAAFLVIKNRLWEKFGSAGDSSTSSSLVSEDSHSHGNSGDGASSESSVSSYSSDDSSSSDGASSSDGSTDTSSYTAEDCDPISFHFIDRQEQYSGDAVYIKVGDTDILIDAGARQSSATAIKNYLNDSSRDDYVSDGKLEYVITTHGHQDHIAGMVGKKSTGAYDGIYYSYKIDNLIDFSYLDSKDGKNVINNADPSNSKGDSRFVSYAGSNSTSLYQKYVDARNYAVSQGTIWKTAGELCNSSTNYSYTVNLGKGVTMSLLYTYFYDHTSKEATGLESSYTPSGFSDQNDYSVCVLFKQGERNFLFTGDAEEYAEHSLVKYNTLPKVDLFKAGHHGSYTASSDELLDAIDPELCVVTCCAGNTEYTTNSAHTFPAQEFVDRIAKHTDKVYVTTLDDPTCDEHCKAFNGNVVASYDSSSRETLSFSNNSLKLKESEWMKNNRTMPDSWK